MVMRKGYINTDVGLIPQDWDCLSIDEVLSEISMGPFGSDIKVSNFQASGIPVLNGYNVNSIVLKDIIANYVTSEKARSLKKAVARRGDIVVTHRGTIGQISIIPMDSKFDQYVISQSQFRVSIKSTIALPHFIVLYFHTIQGQNRLLEKKGHTGVPALAQPTTNFRKLKFPCPPIMEQAAIVAALSDVDNLIVSLEILIAKKKAIKQGVMQELFTGKIRLHGYTEKWIRKEFGDICRIINGGTPSTSISEYWGGTIMWCTPSDITACKSKYISATASTITEKGLNSCSASILPIGTLLLCSRATIGEVRIAKTQMATNQGFKALIANDNINNEWLYYLVNTLKPRMIEKAIGSTFLEISKGDLSAINIGVPSYEEQIAVATVLSDMDSEIEQLEKKLEKYHLIKQGMMQELLSGRIRLVQPSIQPEVVGEQKIASIGHNQPYDDAIAISAIVNAFYHEKYFLGRVKIQKLLYLLRRKQDVDVSAFKKKAAGPYNEEARYKGGESIAIKKHYIFHESGDKGSRFSRGPKIDEALNYVGSMQEYIDWLLDKFRYYNTNKMTKNLEVLATVDMAVCELRKDGKNISVDAVKDVIRSNPEWAPKLQKEYFADENIRQSIVESKQLFGQ